MGSARLGLGLETGMSRGWMVCLSWGRFERGGLGERR